MPFILAGLSIFHIAALHQYGSTNPLGINTQGSTIPFGTYFTSKDLLGFLFMLLTFAILVFFYPEYLGQLAKLKIFWSSSNCLLLPIITIGRAKYYNNVAICWKNPLLFVSTCFIYKVKSLKTSENLTKSFQYYSTIEDGGQSAGNFNSYLLKGSSETTRDKMSTFLFNS